MAAHLQKLVRKTSTTPFNLLRGLTSTEIPQSPCSSAVLPALGLDSDHWPGHSRHAAPTLDRSGGALPCSVQHFQMFFPAFIPMQHLDPINPYRGVVLGEESEDVRDVHDRTMWADSVKKKRKRKMNKHKLRKLRRLLRRKTKT